MTRSYPSILERNNCVGTGSVCLVYNVSPTIVVKSIRAQRFEAEQRPFRREINFFECLKKQQDQCPDIVECFLALPDHLFLSICPLNNISHRFSDGQAREKLPHGFPGRLIQANEYEDRALIARWLQQITSALEYINKMSWGRGLVLT